VELVAERCCARSNARKYDNHWLICTVPVRAITRDKMKSGTKETLVSRASTLHVQARGEHKVGVLEDTLMDGKEVRGRAGLQRKSNRATVASTSLTPLSAKTQGGLRGILYGQTRARPDGRIPNLI
jgi:hypothetical protein